MAAVCIRSPVHVNHVLEEFRMMNVTGNTPDSIGLRRVFREIVLSCHYRPFSLFFFFFFVACIAVHSSSMDSSPTI